MKKIRIEQDVQIPGTDILLEAGDTLTLQEAVREPFLSAFQMLEEATTKLSSEVIVSLIKNTVIEGEPRSLEEFFNDLRDNIGEEISYL